MATQFVTCCKCQQSHPKPTYHPFKVTCYRCGTIIGSDDGNKLWFDLTNYNSYWNTGKPLDQDSSDRVYRKVVKYMFGIPIVALVICTLYLTVRSIGGRVSSQANTLPQPKQQFAPNAISTDTTTTTERSISIYSGQCTYYKKELKDSSMYRKPVSTGFAKVVINRNLKKLYFYFNSKLVFHYFGYNSYTDDQEGGEGFTFDSDADAHRYTAEKVFILNTEMIMGGQLGYQYELTNYRED